MTSPVAAKEMKQLMDHQKELRSWIIDVNRRIYELEEQYLEVKLYIFFNSYYIIDSLICS
jgi:hypothetical protein